MTVMVTTYEVSRTIVTDMAWSWNMAPAMPPRKTRGMNTAHVVRTELSIGAITSPVPFNTACLRSPSLCHRPVMLSTRTMVLSVIIPTPRRSPESEIMFSERPTAWKQSIENTRATGMVSATRAGERKSLINRNMTTQASRSAMTMFCRRLLIEYSRSSVWSLVILKSKLG